MELNDIAEFFQKYLLDHWPFLVVSFMLGIIGNIFKTKVWTKERAKQPGWYGKFCWWVRAFLPIHAPAAGGWLGLIGWKLMGENVPMSPVEHKTGLLVVLYYMMAGAFSSFVFAAWKHFLQSRDIPIPSELDDETTPVPGDEPPKKDEP